MMERMEGLRATVSEQRDADRAKAYLSRWRPAERLIEGKLEQIQRARALSQMTTHSLATVTGGGAVHVDPIGSAVARLDGLERELDGQLRQLFEMLSEITAMLERVSSLRVRAVLEQRYLCLKAWGDIADAMGCSLRQVYNLHTRGLKIVGGMLAAQ